MLNRIPSNQSLKHLWADEHVSSKVIERDILRSYHQWFIEQQTIPNQLTVSRGEILVNTSLYSISTVLFSLHITKRNKEQKAENPWKDFQCNKKKKKKGRQERKKNITKTFLHIDWSCDSSWSFICIVEIKQHDGHWVENELKFTNIAKTLWIECWIDVLRRGMLSCSNRIENQLGELSCQFEFIVVTNQTR